MAAPAVVYNTLQLHPRVFCPNFTSLVSPAFYPESKPIGYIHYKLVKNAVCGSLAEKTSKISALKCAQSF